MNRPTTRTADNRPPGGRGFTLIESLFAVLVVGLAVVAIVRAQHVHVEQHVAAHELDLAHSLANEVRELTLTLPLRDPTSNDAVFGPEADERNDDPHIAVGWYDDIDDFADDDGSGTTLCPPISALREPFNGMDRWTQVVTVENVAPDDLAGAAVAAHSTNVLRMTCSVQYIPPGQVNPRELESLTWIRAAKR